MPEPLADPRAVLDALGVAAATDIRPVTGGRDTTIWRLVAGDRPAALRLFRADQGASCRREVAAMRAAAAAGLPVPELLAEGRWQDRPALLLQWLPGRTLIDELGAHPWRVWRLGRDFGRLQARLHALPAPADLGPAPDRLLAWLGHEAPSLQARLRSLEADPPRLLHLDYHPLNVLTDGRRITALLDWTNAAAGDPRADLARTSAILVIEPRVIGLSAPLRLGLRLLLVAWRRGYRQAAGRPTEMAPYMAWAGLALARDRAPRPGRRGGLTPDQLTAVRRWSATWLARANLPPSEAGLDGLPAT